MQKNIVLVSQVFHPNTQSTSLLLNDLALHIQDENTKIAAICGFPNGAANSTVQRHEDFQGIDIYRCGFNVDLKSGLIARALSYVSYLSHAAFKLLLYPHKDIVIGVSNPPFLPIVLAVVSAISGKNFFFIMHDVYPEGLTKIGKLGEKSIVTKVWHKVNQWSYGRAEKIVVLGRDMKSLLIRDYNIAPERIEIIPNWSLVKTKTCPPFEGNSLAAKLKITDKFVVQYSGNMGIWHDIDSLVRAASRLQAVPDICFLFIGNGVRQKQARQLAKELKVDNIIWMDFVPQEELEVSLSCSHVALISLNTGLEGIAIPCKLYGILSSGRAIIAQVPKESEVAYVVEEENCGCVVDPGDVDGLVCAVKKLYDDRELTGKMGASSFASYRSKYTVESITKKFQSLLNI